MHYCFNYLPNSADQSILINVIACECDCFDLSGLGLSSCTELFSCDSHHFLRTAGTPPSERFCTKELRDESLSKSIRPPGAV